MQARAVLVPTVLLVGTVLVLAALPGIQAAKGGNGGNNHCKFVNYYDGGFYETWVVCDNSDADVWDCSSWNGAFVRDLYAQPVWEWPSPVWSAKAPDNNHDGIICMALLYRN